MIKRMILFAICFCNHLFGQCFEPFEIYGDNIDKPWYLPVAEKIYRLYVDVETGELLAVDMSNKRYFLPWWIADEVFPDMGISSKNYREANSVCQRQERGAS